MNAAVKWRRCCDESDNIYDGEVDRVITRFTSLLEPIMILVMGILVFCIVVAILLPIFEMGQMVR